MNIFFKSKKAIESKILVSIIILLIGFFIVALFFYNIPWEDEIDKEACHTSVIARMSIPDSLINSAKDLVPLNCKTKKICITDKNFGKGNCENNFGKDFITLRLDEKDKENQIKSFLAQEIAECWNIMGEGKGRLFRDDSYFEEVTCVVYSIIDFDDTVLKETKTIKNFKDYLFENKVPNSNQYYSQFLFDQIHYKKNDVSKDIELNKKAIIFYEAHGGKAIEKIITMGSSIGLGVFGFSLGPLLGMGGIILGASIGQNLADILVDSDDKNSYISGFYLVDYNSESLSLLNCKSFENLV
jgi:hypothetical protein